MCGRYTQHHTAAELQDRFGLQPVLFDLSPRYNIAPTQSAAVIRAGEAGAELAMMKWGLVPSWAKDPGIGSRMINARSETVADKPAFRRALRVRRCLVPADGFYEWRADPGGKTPFLAGRRDGELFAFAGLWESWRDPDNGELQTFTILTTTPNSLLAGVHDRMPVILDRGAESIWLDASVTDSQELQPLLKPLPEAEMTLAKVSRRVNRPAEDDSGLIEPVTG